MNSGLPPRLPRQLVLERGERRIVAEQIGDDPARRGGRETVQPDLDVAAVHQPARVVVGAVREERERGRRRLARKRVEKIARVGRHPLQILVGEHERAVGRHPAAQPHQRGEHALAPLGDRQSKKR